MTKTIAPSASRMTAGAPDQDSSLPKTAGPQVQDVALSPDLSRRPECEKQRQDASEWMEVIGWLPRSYEAELHGIVEDAFKAGYETAERLQRTAPAGEVVAKAVAALTEAEAILGGEYGDHYGVLCQQMIELRAALSATPAPVDDAEEQVRVIAGTQSNPNPEGG